MSPQLDRGGRQVVALFEQTCAIEAYLPHVRVGVGFLFVRVIIDDSLGRVRPELPPESGGVEVICCD